MIQKTQAFKSSDGAIHSVLEAAQHAELVLLILKGTPTEAERKLCDIVVGQLIANKAKVIDILTTTANSIPAARAVNGGKKPRKKKDANAEAQTLNLGYVPAAQ